MMPGMTRSSDHRKMKISIKRKRTSESPKREKPSKSLESPAPCLLETERQTIENPRMSGPEMSKMATAPTTANESAAHPAMMSAWMKQTRASIPHRPFFFSHAAARSSLARFISYPPKRAALPSVCFMIALLGRVVKMKDKISFSQFVFRCF